MAPLAARGAGWRGARGAAVARRPGRGAPSRGASSVLLCIQVELNVNLVVCFARVLWESGGDLGVTLGLQSRVATRSQTRQSNRYKSGVWQ